MWKVKLENFLINSRFVALFICGNVNVEAEVFHFISDKIASKRIITRSG